MDDFEIDVPKMVWPQLDPDNNAPFEKKEMVTGRLRWLIFSDTVFVAMPFDLSAHPDTSKFNLIFFAILVAHINRRMFEIGLPVRGAIHVGDVLLGKKCFAGKPLVEAFRLAKKFQVAAAVISEQANTFIFNRFSDSTGFQMMFKNLIIECDVPTGTKQLSNSIWTSASEKMKTLCWFYLQIGWAGRFTIPSDLNRFIIEKFTAHGKKVSGEKEKMKVINTEKLFNDWKAANRRDYQKNISA